jgi:hypothetical protein
VEDTAIQAFLDWISQASDLDINEWLMQGIFILDETDE